MYSELVLVGPSPRYIDDDEYVGGFQPKQIEELLDFLADNYLGWSPQWRPRSWAIRTPRTRRGTD